MSSPGYLPTVIATVADWSFVKIAAASGTSSVTLKSAVAGSRWALMGLALTLVSPGAVIGLHLQSGSTNLFGDATTGFELGQPAPLLLPPSASPWCVGVADSDFTIERPTACALAGVAIFMDVA